MTEHTPDDEAGARRQALEAYGALDGSPRPELDRLTALAARLAGARAALVEVGAGDDWTTLSRFPAEEPADGGGLAPVAPVSLRTPDGVPFGRLRVLGAEPESAVLEDLRTVAESIVTVLELEVASRRLFDAEEAAALAGERVVAVAGQIAHDLNNPLAAMAMSLEIALDQVDDTQPLLRSLLERATGGAARMKRMTADLLAFAARPLSDGDEPQPTPQADLQRVVEHAAASLDGLHPGRVTVEAPLPRVAASPEDLAVVVMALLENAVKFAADGVAPDVRVSAEPAGDAWLVRFADNGRGIPAEELGRVFDPMVRLDKRVPGLGLGLSTAKRIVTSLGGEMGAEVGGGPSSGPGSDLGASGTTLWFSLPRAPSD